MAHGDTSNAYLRGWVDGGNMPRASKGSEGYTSACPVPHPVLLTYLFTAPNPKPTAMPCVCLCVCGGDAMIHKMRTCTEKYI